MKKKKEKLHNIALIDSQNVNRGVIDDGWRIDNARFRRYLKEKYNVSEAYMFFGYYDKEYDELYESLQKVGFIIKYKAERSEILTSQKKGNVDSTLISFAYDLLLDDKDKFNKIVLVSGDGDYIDLVKKLNSMNKFEKILFPNLKHSSSLYKKFGDKKCDYLYKRKNILEYKKKINKNG